MIDILHARMGLHFGDTHRLKLQHDQGTQHVLQQRLVDSQANFGAGRHVTADPFGRD
ncbi:hypothetical protein D3C81_2118320 [compost metagenome]